MISPILERLTGDSTIKTGTGRSLDLVTVDTDKEHELAQKYQVSCCVIACFALQTFMFHTCPPDTLVADGNGLQRWKTSQAIHWCAR